MFNFGKVYEHSQPDLARYEVNGLNNCSKLFPYFDKFPLRSKKLQSYILWKKIYLRLLAKEHLNPQLRPILKDLAGPTAEINN